MADNVKKGDIVRMNYNAYIADTGRLYDTTDAEKAKEAGIFDEKYSYAPMPFIVGSGKLFKPIEEAISGAKVGEDNSVEISSDDAVGPRDPKLVELHTMNEFAKQGIRPFPGLSVRLGDRTGIVESVSAGRVRVDFNNPLAGKDLRYEFTITEVVSDAEAKASSVVQMDFGTSEDFSFEISKDKVTVKVSDLVKFNSNWLMAKFRIVSDLRDVLGVDTVEFLEVWEKPKEKADDKAEE